MIRPYCRLHSLASTPRSYTPDQVAALYGFPKVNVPPAVVAIGELGGGYDPAAVASYFRSLGLPAPKLTDVPVRGATNSPGSDADVEVMLDICVAGAAYSYCTGQPANLLIVFAPNDGKGIADATMSAMSHPSKPSVLSWSWGAPEDSWDRADFLYTEATLSQAAAGRMLVTAAAGDNGSGDGERGNHVDYPASSASVIACGGTTIRTANGRITAEATWNDGSRGGATGGGFSALVPRPSWQASYVPGRARGVPDVAADADPQTGYSTPDGVVGGTSAVAPLIAALAAVLGVPNAAWLYSRARCFNDVITGNNGAFKAHVGWDPDTGLGSPNGRLLAS